jgi:hypothetical protein
MTITVTAPDDVAFIDAWVGADGVRLTRRDDVFSTTIDTTALAPGEHTVLLARDGSETAFARHTFVRTHPLYVLVGTDWDDSDNPASSYALQDELHATFPELKITHFVGPYTFTDPALTPARVDEIVA